MKSVHFVLKVVALALAIAAAVCCVIAYWDRLSCAVGSVTNKIRSRKKKGEELLMAEGDEEYTDWDE